VSTLTVHPHRLSEPSQLAWWDDRRVYGAERAAGSTRGVGHRSETSEGPGGVAPDPGSAFRKRA